MLLSEAVQGGGLFSYAPWIIGFPILVLLINLIIGRRVSEKSVGAIASSAIALSFVVAVIQFIALQAEPEGMVPCTGRVKIEVDTPGGVAAAIIVSLI